ncbi:MAG: hypothetical protein ABSF95_18510 [Verrucomicrobiota bacterium]|jgi:hypothetical protein
MPATGLFSEAFLANVQTLVQRHHTIYPRLPPQGVFFEALVEQAFRLSGWAANEVVPTTPNSPWHDLLVGTARLSIKSETGKATKRTKISITKLCTTEAGEWTAKALVNHAIAHVDRHDRMLMLRAIWKPGGFDYQLVEIPLELLKRMRNAQFSGVGSRPGRESVGGDVMLESERVFHVHFDGADGKCQVHGLLIQYCKILREWNQPIP